MIANNAEYFRSKLTFAAFEQIFIPLTKCDIHFQTT